MKRINTENFIPILFLIQFLETLQILQNFPNFAKISRFVFGPIFRKLNSDIGIKSRLGQLIFLNTTGKTNQTTDSQKLFGYNSHFIDLLFFEKNTILLGLVGNLKKNLIFQI